MRRTFPVKKVSVWQAPRTKSKALSSPQIGRLVVVFHWRYAVFAFILSMKNLEILPCSCNRFLFVFHREERLREREFCFYI